MTSRQELFSIVDDAFSATSASSVAAEMTKHYRGPGTSGYKKAMSLVESELSNGYLDDIEVRHPKIDPVWEPNDAWVKLDGETDPIVSFSDAPGSLSGFSSPTEGVEKYELISVGTGENKSDFAEIDVEGKAVFISGTTRRPGWWEAAKNAVENGAAGIITDYMLYQTPGVRTPELVPEATQWLRLRPPEFFIDAEIWAFSVSHDAAKQLKSSLEKSGSVMVDVSIDVSIYSDTMPTIEATIEGREIPEERVLYCGHASGIRPGANCAEGTGLVVELAKTISKLIDDGVIERPRRSLTFILGAEGPVSGEYLEQYPDAAEDVITALSYCSTGHKQSETESCLLLSQSPDSVDSFINDYLDELVMLCPKEADWIGKEGGKELPLLSLKQHYYTPWSDNMRFAAAGIPAPLFMSWPDRCFHSQLLTEKVIDPAALHRSALISGVAGIELANAAKQTARSIANLVAGKSVDRIRRIGSRYQTEEELDRRAIEHIKYVSERDIGALESVERLSKDTSETISQLHSEIERVTADELDRLVPSQATDEVETPLSSIVPVRETDELVGRWAGLEYQDLLDIAETLNETDENSGWRSLRVISDETWNFVDGNRTVEDIAKSVGFEFDLKIATEPIYQILEGHKEAGNLSFKNIDE